ncbi:molybdenum cofactor biosynthesis protein MoaE [Actinocatenispora rupis]|uniref:Molybdenum cofactor biosynthesis protein MoaE n=1 Tax=Actinocatenispora rupis TaxID=519421 RepID=A0A8J3JED1_9ACTN|nr:molybdenum cofactor biosynthesis protein MoaE [Actinocatenispora rupis]GID13308.1 molybdenum cofactor biosynthesis protein MoaE [Actinocatenispora rupis]
MTGVVVRAEVTDRPLVAGEYEAAVAHRSAGAVVSFAGVVRDHDGGRTVRTLTYEGHPSAPDVLAKVAADAVADDKHLYAVALGHRIGALAIGDAALVVAVSCAHRGAAFDACRRLVDEVKARLPIWKHQVFADGTEEWVNCP